MYFTSSSFVAFLCLVLVGYFFVFRRFQWQFLLAASVIFYAFSGWENLIYICLTVITTYLAGRKMNQLQAQLLNHLAQHEELSSDEKKALRAETKRKRKRWLVACLLFNFALLAMIKYSNFILTNVNGLLALLGVNASLGLFGLALPLGISFYTFQTMGYLIDVYRSKKADAAEENIFRLALFASYFPQVVQGPISRYGDLSKELFVPHAWSSDAFTGGLLRVIWGFFKKLVVADRLLVAIIALVGAEYTGVYVLINIVFYMLTLYADFTGGIDITLGVSQMLGIRVVENFDRPFHSKSVAEFWRRWHITMGTWFRDYLYYPVSTSRGFTKFVKQCKKIFGDRFGVRLPAYLVTLLVWFTTGLWHGSSWNFIAWGVCTGLVMVLSQELTPLYKRFHERFAFSNTKAYDGFQMVRTFFVTATLCVIDIYPGIPATLAAFASIFTGVPDGMPLVSTMLSFGLLATDYLMIALGTLVMVAAGGIYHRFYQEKGVPMQLRWALCVILFFAVLIFGRYGIGFDASQFIYNQF